MKISTPSFRGMAPRVTPRALPPNAAQTAINTRLLTGDLEAWRRPLLTKQLAVSSFGDVETIALLDDAWLSWQQQVEVARGIIPGDETFRTYITGLDAPRVTNKALATTGSEPFPVATRLLGVPAPEEAPDVVVTITPPPEGNITITNPGAETGTTLGWTIDAGALVVLEDGDIPGFDAQTGDFYFGGGAAAETEASQEIDLEAADVIVGQGLSLAWWQAAGADGGLAAMGIRFFNEADTMIGEVLAEQVTITPTLTWQQRTLTTQVPDGAVKAELVQLYTRVGGAVIDAYIDTITLTSIDYTNSFDGSSLSGWTTSPNEGGGNFFRRITVANDFGRPSPSFRFEMDSRLPYFFRDFSADSSPALTLVFDTYIASPSAGVGGDVALFASAGGLGSGLTWNANGIVLGNYANWGSAGAVSEQLYSGAISGRWLTVTLNATQTSAGTARLTTRVVDAESGTVYVDDHVSVMAVNGPMIGWKGNGDLGGRFVYIDNIAVTIAAPDPTAEEETLYTSYVYVWVNEFGEFGAPSPASVTVQRNSNATATITTPTVLPTGFEDYGITGKHIYRAATGASGTVFRFVAEIDLATETYVDTLEDSELGEVLESEDWDLPPQDGRFILALPNGIMVMASKNQLCLSVKNRPHAWPVKWRLPTDTYITGLGNVDTSVVIGTKSFVYTASGNDPASYSMSKPGAPQSCVSHRSFAYLLNIGAVFASPDGLMLANGPTQVQNLTETIFTRDQWQALVPSSIVGVAHDDIYFFSFNSNSSPTTTALFLENFDGTGDIRDHTPDVAPDGFVWALEPDIFLSTLTLLGDGSARSADAGNDGQVTSVSSSPALAIELTETFSVGMTATPSPAGGDDDEQVRFQIRDGAQIRYLFMSMFPTPLSLTTTTARFEIGYNGIGSNTLEIVFTASGQHSMRMYFEGGIYYLFFDGTQVGTFTAAALDTITKIELYAATANSETFAYLHQVFIETGENEPSDGTKGTYALDMKPSGFGLVELGFHATAFYVDPEDDALYMVLDNYEEPTSVLLPSQTGADLEEVNGRTIFQFNAGEELMRYSWTGKLWLLPYTMALQWVRMRAKEFADVAIEVDADENPLYGDQVASNRPFRLPMLQDYDEIQYTLIGTSRVRGVEIADDITELE